FFACLVRFESSSVPTTLPTAYDVYPLDGRHDGGYYTVKDCVTIDVLPRTPGNNVYVYQYFCVPEYGTANGRLHFHAVHFMRTLPTGSVDPNFGRRVRNRRQLNSLQNTWPYGYSMPIAVRYTQDAFSRSGWL